MMILRSAPPSPYGRKVKIAAALTGLFDEISIVTTDTLSADDPLRSDNPLGKIPALIIEDGTVIFDSRVIVNYLDMRAGGGKIMPRSGIKRIKVETMQALADGIMDASLLQVYEARWRQAAFHDAKWLEHQAGKVSRGLAYFEANLPSLTKNIHIGQISLACALGYLDLRFNGTWRKKHPKLLKWMNKFSDKVPAFEKTRAIA